MNRHSLSVLLLLALSGLVAGLDTENIFGGERVFSIRQYPYQVSVQALEQHICGGSLIAEDLVVSAAHCFVRNIADNYKDYDYRVVAGTIDLKIMRNTPIDVAYVYVHKDYLQDYPPGSKVFVNDIAVLRLKSKFAIGGNTGIDLIDLPKENETLPVETGVVTGYGFNKIKYNQSQPFDTDEYFYSNDWKMYRYTYRFVTDWRCFAGQYRICAVPEKPPTVPGSEKEPEDPEFIGVCDGDSGGPIAHRPSYNKTGVIIGIVSATNGRWCISPSKTYFTEVSYYVRWIRNIMENKIDYNDTVVYDAVKKISVQL